MKNREDYAMHKEQKYSEDPEEIVRSQFYSACYRCDIDEIKRIIGSNHIDPACQSGEALIYTIRGIGPEHSKKEILKYFKSLGVDLNMREKVTLKWAILTGNLNLVEFLQTEGVSFSDVEDHVLTAAINNKIEILNFLAANGATISTTTLGDIADYSLPEETLNIIMSFKITE